jgi:hypothetical protein
MCTGDVQGAERISGSQAEDMTQTQNPAVDHSEGIRSRLGGATLVGTGIGVPVLVFALASLVCAGDCYPHAESALIWGIPLFIAGSVAGVLMTGWSTPTQQRHVGRGLLIAAVPYGLFVGGIVGSVMGGGSGDYLVMTIGGYVFGLMCLVLWLVLGTITVVAGWHRARRPPPESTHRSSAHARQQP